MKVLMNSPKSNLKNEQKYIDETKNEDAVKLVEKKMSKKTSSDQ